MAAQTCSNCGGDMIGDGVSVVRHCEHTDPLGLAPDSTPVQCKPTRVVRYVMSITITRPVRLYDYDSTLAETEAWMVSRDGKRELENEVRRVMLKIDGDIAGEVLEVIAEDEQ